MADPRSPAAPRFRTWTLLAAIAVVLVGSTVADARTLIRTRDAYDSFFFHGNYSSVQFDPQTDFTLEVWNCADGAMPFFVADATPIIACDWDADTGFTLADLVYSVDVPAGTCVDHGRSCYFRDRTVPSSALGLRYFKVQYARAGRGNRVWLDSYGDLSAADQANMLILIKIDDHPRASRSDTFIPLVTGGWFSR